MTKNTFHQKNEDGCVEMPKIPEGISMRMVTLSHGCSSRVKLKSRYNSVIMVKGKGLVQGIQVLNSWDTVLIERENGVTTPELHLEALGAGSNSFLVVQSEGTEAELLLSYFLARMYGG